MPDILNIRNLSVHYKDAECPAISGFSMDIPDKSIVAIVGESGSGKSTVIRAIINLLCGGGRITGGEILYRGRNLVGLPENEYRKLRGKHISMIFQDAYSTMDPRKKIAYQYIESLLAHMKISKAKARAMGINMLSRMALPDPERIMDSYPFELSGGMAQRVAIAMSLSNHSDLLLADEPTSALDVTVQAQVAKVIMHLRDEHEKSVIIVTHNLGLAAYMADYIAVMHHGRLVEWGQSERVLNHPDDEYTKMLINSIPDMEVAEFD
ncbi:MAG: ABC transporter ATP-binding protein [Clostridia bacterium]|nr:ABC transporter ATP-binding protein [Clostridia bacterium]